MANYAIVQTGGKQYRMEPGRFYDLELLAAEPGDKLTLAEVLLVKAGEAIALGQPRVEGARVEGTVIRHLRAKKVIVYKMKPKKKTRKKNGHRQNLTRFLVETIHSPLGEISSAN
ncbi:MAG TPA: 50S ribosomal protein L21 [Cyanobacteria bacterium UBA8156]|jgi:large subunit ribosomal protein L21|nr:50S ribosomal protein L21 [Cyanobacteria bacterium UBA8156]